MSSSFVHYFHLGHAYEVRRDITCDFRYELLGVDFYTKHNLEEIEEELIKTANTMYHDYEDSEGIEDLNQVQEHFSSNQIENMIDEMPDVYLNEVDFTMSGDVDDEINQWISDNNLVEYIANTVRTLQD